MLKLRYASQYRLWQRPIRSSPSFSRSLFLSNRSSVISSSSIQIRWLSQEINSDGTRKTFTQVVGQNEQRVIDQNDLSTKQLFFSPSSEPIPLSSFQDLRHVVSLLEAAETIPERARILKQLAATVSASNKIIDAHSQKQLLPFVESVFQAHPRPHAAILADAAELSSHLSPGNERLVLFRSSVSDAIQSTLESVGNGLQAKSQKEKAEDYLATLRLLHASKGWFSAPQPELDALFSGAFCYSADKLPRMLETLQLVKQFKLTFDTLPKECAVAASVTLHNASIHVNRQSPASTSAETQSIDFPTVDPIDYTEVVQFLDCLEAVNFPFDGLPLPEKQTIWAAMVPVYSDTLKLIVEDAQQVPPLTRASSSPATMMSRIMQSMVYLFNSDPTKNYISAIPVFEALSSSLPLASSTDLSNILWRLQKMYSWASIPPQTQQDIIKVLTNHFQQCKDPVSAQHLYRIPQYMHGWSPTDETKAVALPLQKATINFLDKYPLVKVGERVVLHANTALQATNTLHMLASSGVQWKDLPLSVQKVFADILVRSLPSFTDREQYQALQKALRQIGCLDEFRNPPNLVKKLFAKAVTDPWMFPQYLSPFDPTDMTQSVQQTRPVNGGAFSLQNLFAVDEGEYASKLIHALGVMDVDWNKLSAATRVKIVSLAFKSCTIVNLSTASFERSISVWYCLVKKGLTRDFFRELETKGIPEDAAIGMTPVECQIAAEKWFFDAISVLYRDLIQHPVNKDEEMNGTASDNAKNISDQPLPLRFAHVVAVGGELPIRLSPPSSSPHDRPTYVKRMEDLLTHRSTRNYLSENVLDDVVQALAVMGWKWTHFEQPPVLLEKAIWERYFFVSKGVPSESLMRRSSLSLDKMMAQLRWLTKMKFSLPTVATDASPIIHPSMADHYATCPWKKATFAELPFVLTQQSQRIHTAVNVAPMLQAFWDFIYLQLAEASPYTMRGLKGNVPSLSPTQMKENGRMEQHLRKERAEELQKESEERIVGRKLLTQVFERVSAMIPFTPPVRGISSISPEQFRFRTIDEQSVDGRFEELTVWLTLMSRSSIPSQNLWRGVYIATLKRRLDILMGIDPDKDVNLGASTLSLAQTVFLMELYQKVYGQMWKFMSPSQRDQLARMFQRLKKDTEAKKVISKTTLMTPAEEIMSPLFHSMHRGQILVACGAYNSLKTAALSIMSSPEAFQRIVQNAHRGYPVYDSSADATNQTESQKWSSNHPFYLPCHHPLASIIDTLDLKMHDLPLNEQALRSLLMEARWKYPQDQEMPLSLLAAFRQLRLSWKSMEPAFAHWFANQLAESVKEAPAPSVGKAARWFSSLAYDLPWHRYDVELPHERDQQLMSSAVTVCAAILSRIQQRPHPVEYFQASAINTLWCLIDHFLPRDVSRRLYTKAFNMSGKRPTFANPGVLAMIPEELRSPSLNLPSDQRRANQLSLDAVGNELTERGISWVKYETWLNDWMRVYYSEEALSSLMAEDFTLRKNADRSSLHPKIIVDPKFVAVESGYEFLSVSLRKPIPPSSDTNKDSSNAGEIEYGDKIPVAFVSILPYHGPSPSSSSLSLPPAEVPTTSSTTSSEPASWSPPSSTEMKPLSLIQDMHQVIYSRMFPHASFFYVTVKMSEFPMVAKTICGEIVKSPIYRNMMIRDFYAEPAENVPSESERDVNERSLSLSPQHSQTKPTTNSNGPVSPVKTPVDSKSKTGASSPKVTKNTSRRQKSSTQTSASTKSSSSKKTGGASTPKTKGSSATSSSEPKPSRQTTTQNKEESVNDVKSAVDEAKDQPKEL